MTVPGTSWAAQFLAPYAPRVGLTQGGMPLMPGLGGYSGPVQLPYMAAPHTLTRPAGVGPIEMGSEGFSRAWYTAKPAAAGRNTFGSPWRQGCRYDTYAAGVQGLNATVRRVA